MCEQCSKADRAGFSRRHLIGALSAAVVAGSNTPGRWAQAAEPAKPSVTPDVALKRLMDGHAKYLANKASLGDYAAGRAKRATGQSPIATILSCSDSRVPPELIFNQGPGRAFVIRVAGNVENADGLATLEYGAKFLGSPLIMVMGHSGCGAVDAAIKVHRDKAVLPGHLPGLIDRLVPAVKAAEAARPSDLLAAAVTENVRRTVHAISANAPVLAPMITAGTVKVVGSVYDIATGKVTLV
jgi:carbonic anhydrase